MHDVKARPPDTKFVSSSILPASDRDEVVRRETHTQRGEERDTHTHTERERERDTQRGEERDRESLCERERERERERHTQRGKERETHTRRERERGDRCVCELAHLHMCVTTNNEYLSLVI